MLKKQNGFAHWLFLILIIILIAGVGVFVVAKHKGGSGGILSSITDKTSSDNDCNSKAGLLKYSPVPIDKVSTVVPLGNFAPPGHVTPTPHMYYNFIPTPGHNLPQKTDLVVPADMTITKLWLFDQGPTQPYKAYRLDFTICSQVSGYFILILNLPDKLASLASAPWDQTQTSNVGNGIQHNYWKKVDVKMTAGESLGSAGGFEGAPDGLDFGLQDSREKQPTQANPDRFKQPGGPLVCSLDYYDNSLSTQLYNKLGGFDYVARNPGEPRCGTVYQDAPGTAQGIWFSQDTSVDQSNNVNAQLTLGHWNLDQSKGVFSAGNNIKQIGLNSSNIYLFTPQKSGTNNLDFNLVKPGKIYCYDVSSQGQSSDSSIAHILIKLTDDKTLQIGKTSSCSTSISVISSPLTYIR